MKFFIYSRKSVYREQSESVENQIDMCRNYIKTKFSDIKNIQISVYEDEGFSAKNTARPQFKLMLSHIRNEKPDFIVCYRLDRISRNVSDFSAFIEELNRLNISFICIKEEFDTSKPMGKAMMYIASVFSQLERETIAERVRDNMMMLAKTGRWLGGKPPLGYTSLKHSHVLIDDKTKTLSILKEKPNELSIVQQIYCTYLTTQSISQVKDNLALNKIQSPSGNFYSYSGIKQILQNPVYCIADTDAFNYFTRCGCNVCFTQKQCSNTLGISAYNKRDYSRKSIPRNPLEKWIIAVGKHPGIFKGSTWIKVQMLLKKRKSRANYSLLSGRIFCSQCSHPMTAKQRSKENIMRYDYICSNKLHQGINICSCRNIEGISTDKNVILKIIEYILSSYNTSFHMLSNISANDIENSLSIAEKQRIIETFTNKIIWDGKEIKIYI